MHGTTQEKPSTRLEEEKSYLTPYVPQLVPVSTKEETEVSCGLIPNIDISYFTTLSDYEEILIRGERYAS